MIQLFLLTLFPILSHALTLEQFYKAEDGTDYSPSFSRLMKSEECKSGCKIEIGCKTYLFSDTLQVCKPVLITGCGQRLSILAFASGKSGIHLGYGQCIATEEPGAASSVIENIGVQAGSEVKPTAQNPADYVMIDVKTGTITIRNVRTTGGRHGIRIDAATTRPGADQSNSNHWRLDQVSSYNTHHSPIFVKGADSNAGVGTSVSAVNGCKYASTLKALSIANPTAFPSQLQQCGGIHDQSFLGNTWIGSHVAGIRDDVDPTIGYPGYLSVGDNQHTVFLGSYTERDSNCGVVATRSLSLGGIGCMAGTGLVFTDQGISNLILIKPTITTGPIGMDSITGAQTLMTFRFPGSDQGKYISWIYDQRHRADGVTPVYAAGHDALTLKVDGLNSKTVQKWSLGIQ